MHAGKLHLQETPLLYKWGFSQPYFLMYKNLRRNPMCIRLQL